MKKYGFLVIAASLVLFVAGSSFKMFNGSTPSGNNAPALMQDKAATDFPNGAKIYKEKCFACHQLNGEGIASVFPPLKGSDYLFADKHRAVNQVLNGSNHGITVNGVTYATPMPPQVDNHQDAVDVINYVLNAWGNEGGTVKLEDVKDIKIIR